MRSKYAEWFIFGFWLFQVFGLILLIMAFLQLGVDVLVDGQHVKDLLGALIAFILVSHVGGIFYVLIQFATRPPSGGGGRRLPSLEAEVRDFHAQANGGS